MHDEDAAIGLLVENPSGESWMCYGDKRALDKVAADNLKRCVAAVQASADEVYAAYTMKTVPSPNAYKAWAIAPTLESARRPQELTPLFKYRDGTRKDVERRQAIEDRRTPDFTADWWPSSTAAECRASGWWKYPITIDGPAMIVPGSGLAVTTLPQAWSTRLYFQNPLSGVLESTHTGGKWAGGVEVPSLWNAAPFTPLAAVNWGDRGNYVSTDTSGFVSALLTSVRTDSGLLSQCRIQAAGILL